MLFVLALLVVATCGAKGKKRSIASKKDSEEEQSDAKKRSGPSRRTVADDKRGSHGVAKDNARSAPEQTKYAENHKKKDESLSVSGAKGNDDKLATDGNERSRRATKVVSYAPLPRYKDGGASRRGAVVEHNGNGGYGTTLRHLQGISASGGTARHNEENARKAEKTIGKRRERIKDEQKAILADSQRRSSGRAATLRRSSKTPG